jgi:hypothetical protein
METKSDIPIVQCTGTQPKKRVYVAGRLNDSAVDYIKNMHRMIDHTNTIRQMGYSVYVPCLDILMGLVFGNYNYHDYFDNSQPWLQASDMVYVVPGSEISEGTNKEIELAKAMNIPIIRDIRCLYYENN